MKTKLISAVFFLLPALCQAVEEDPAKVQKADPLGLLVVAGLLLLLIGGFVFVILNNKRKERQSAGK